MNIGHKKTHEPVAMLAVHVRLLSQIIPCPMRRSYDGSPTGTNLQNPLQRLYTIHHDSIVEAHEVDRRQVMYANIGVVPGVLCKKAVQSL